MSLSLMEVSDITHRKILTNIAIFNFLAIVIGLDSTTYTIEEGEAVKVTVFVDMNRSPTISDAITVSLSTDCKL